MTVLSVIGHFRILAVAAFVLIFAGSAQAQNAGPFTPLAGSWNGNGSITISNGSHERIRCRAEYNVANAGSTAAISLRCASDSYSFELQGNVRYQNGELRGDWSERTRGAGGMLSGSVKGNQFNVRVEGQTFAALLSLTTRGDKQTISIRTAGGANQMSEATMTLSRRG